MPTEMAIHWNASGDVDGTTSRTLALALIPGISAITLVFFLALPHVDPRDSYDSFRFAYDALAVTTLGVLAYVHAVVVVVNAGFEVDVLQALAPAIGAIYVVAGYVTERAEQNWFVGVRTPWTLEDEAVWRRTNDAVATVLKAGGVVAATGLLVPAYALVLVAAPAVVAAVASVAYSYHLHERGA
jgi:uncharacterized membrane protein